MKKIVILFIILNIGNVFSQSRMTEDEQYDYIDKIDKKTRSQLLAKGHDDVYSEFKEMTYSDLDEYTDPLTNSEYEESLSDTDIKKIYSCKERLNCEVFFISTSSSYYSGTGYENHFILLYLNSRKHWRISHVTYAE